MADPACTVDGGDCTTTLRRPFSCAEEGCGYTASHRGHLAKHARKHTGEFSCTVEGCGYSATIRQHLAAHARTHTGERRERPTPAKRP